MNLFRFVSALRAANRMSLAVTNGRKPHPRDVAELGLTDVMRHAKG